MKRILSLILAVGMLLSAFPVLAAEAVITQDTAEYPAKEYTFEGYHKIKENPNLSVDPKVLTALEGQHPRMFFTNEDIEVLRKDVAEGGRLEDKWKRFLRHIDASVEAGPTEWYESDNAEENWIRDVGDNLAGIALVYWVTKDKKYLEAAEEFIYALCVEYPHWGRPNSSYHNNGLACTHASRALGICYDWLFYDLKPETKELILETAKERTAKLHSGGWWTRSYLMNHLWNDRLGTAVMATAIMDEYPAAKAWIEKSVADYNLVYYYLGVDGGTHEGMLYYNYGMESYMLFKTLAKNTFKVDFTGDPYDQKLWLAGLYAYFNPQDWSNDANCLNWSDSTRIGGGYDMTYIMEYVAETYNNGQAKWLSNRLFEKLQESDGTYADWYQFLWEADIPEVPVNNLPTGHHFEDLGIVQARSGWDQNASYVHWRCGMDVGTESIAFSGSGNLGSGHVHRDINGPIIFGYGEWILRDDGYANYPLKNHSVLYINGIGQPRDTSKDYLAAARSKTLKYIDTEDYTYAACDGTDAYGTLDSHKETYKLDKWIRHFLYLKKKDCLLMIDEVNSAVEQDLELRFITETTTLSNQGPNSIIGQGSTSQVKITNFDAMGEGEKDTWMKPQEVPYNTGTRNVACIGKTAKDWTTATAVTWSPSERNPRAVKLDRYKDDWTFDLDTAVVTVNPKTHEISYTDYGNDLRVKLDAMFLESNVGIYQNENEYYMPFRELFEGMGYKVNYLADTHSVEIINPDSSQVVPLSDSVEEGKLWVLDGHTRITPEQMITMMGIIAYVDDANNIIKVKTYDFDNDTSLANALVLGATIMGTEVEGKNMNISILYEEDEVEVVAIPVSLSAAASVEKISELEYKAKVVAENRVDSEEYNVKLTFPVGLGDVAVKKVVFSDSDGNLGPNSIDGNLGSYWAHQSKDAWIIYELDKEYTIDKIQTTWNAYAKRSAFFELYTSMDGENWTQIGGEHTGEQGVEINELTFDPVKCKYVKIEGNGNGANSWTSLSEIAFFQAK